MTPPKKATPVAHLPERASDAFSSDGATAAISRPSDIDPPQARFSLAILGEGPAPWKPAPLAITRNDCGKEKNETKALAPSRERRCR